MSGTDRYGRSWANRRLRVKRASRLAQGIVVAALSMAFGVALVPAPAGATAPAPAPTPVNSTAPVLTGTPAPGQTLTCSTGAWTNNPSAYTYAWLRDGSPIAGQASSTYVVQGADQGHSISCQVTASNSGGEYTIVGLPNGSYKVSFEPEFGSSLNYLLQYYDNQPSSSTANLVAVTAPNAVTNINGALRAGGEISGKVTAAVGGAALAKIEVCATQAETFGKCATTNAAGEYTIVGLPTGAYTVSSSNESLFGGEANYAPQSQGGVAVTAPNMTSGVNLQLQPGGQISGRVTESGSKGVAGVVVCAFGETFSCAFTNSNGDYVVSGLPSGLYRVAFIPGSESLFGGSSNGNYLVQYYNNRSSLAEADVVQVIAPSVISNIGAVLQPGGQISGTVKSATGKTPLEGVYVCAGASTSGFFGGKCAATNGNGEYTIVGLETATYTVEFLPPSGANYLSKSVTGVSVTAPNSHEHVEAELETGGQIAGMVTDASTHARLANVRVCAASGESGQCASTNATGEYTISGLASSASYTVEFTAQQGSNYAPQTKVGVPVTAPNTTANIDAAMQPGGQISGRVTDAASGSGIANIVVCASGIGSGHFGGCTTTNAPGGSASATSNMLMAPLPNSTFKLVRKVFDAKHGDLDFFFTVANAGTFKWSLFFEKKKCNAGHGKRKHKCVRTKVSFGSGSQGVPAGTVEIEVHASAKALKTLRTTRTLHVSGMFSFQSALGGSPSARTVSAVVHLPKKKGKHHKK